MPDKVSMFNIPAVVVRAPSGNLSAGETVVFAPPSGGDLTKFRSALVYLNVTNIETPDADDRIRFYIQTSYDLGATWEDVANVMFDNADNGVEPQFGVIAVGPAPAGVGVFAHSDGALADNTNRDLPLGDRVRIVVTVAGATAPTYAYEARVTLYG